MTDEHRIADVELTVLGPDGAPLADIDVVVAQLDHAFRFGCTGFQAIELANGELDGNAAAATERLLGHWLELFNTTTLPFYWGRFEPVRGWPDTERLRAAAQWFVDRGVQVKGHPLCWHTESPPWLTELPLDEIGDLQLARIRRDVADFAGLIDTWDVINEAVIMPVFTAERNGITRLAQEVGRLEMVRSTFEAARSTNPGATLLINDFDLSADYERIIEECLDAGIRIDAIGIQSHMHQGYRGVEWTEGILERYARFGLPLHWTENTLVSGELMPAHIVDLNDWQVDDWPTTPEGEARQAEELVTHYRTLVAHPSVASITWWDIQDGGWLNAPAGLIRADGSPKPSFEALRDLIKGEWWLSPTTLRTDTAGRVHFSGWPGEYRVSSANDPASDRIRVDEPREAPDTTGLTARLRAPTPRRPSVDNSTGV
jgi:endo-1,4-beta-xylanase